jgi:hypothetical protein
MLTSLQRELKSPGLTRRSSSSVRAATLRGW